MANEAEERQWYVLRDLKRPNALTPAYRMLDDLGVENFTPQKEVIVTSQGHKKIVRRPIIPDLLFARATRESLDAIIARTATLQYRYVKGAPYRTPMTVSDDDMTKFITATQASDTIRYYTPDELNASMIGRKVTIVGGPLDTLAGNLLKIKGARKKRLLVQLPGIVAFAVEVSPEFIRLAD